VVSTNALARVMVVQMVWRGLEAAVVFALLAAAASGCANTTIPALLTPRSCPGDPCGVMACPSGFVCQLDAQCGAHCQAQPLGNRPF
jgi:hypothetical protein